MGVEDGTEISEEPQPRGLQLNDLRLQLSALVGHTEIDLMAKEADDKDIMLQRFQRENPVRAALGPEPRPALGPCRVGPLEAAEAAVRFCACCCCGGCGSGSLVLSVRRPHCPGQIPSRLDSPAASL